VQSWFILFTICTVQQFSLLEHIKLHSSGNSGRAAGKNANKVSSIPQIILKVTPPFSFLLRKVNRAFTLWARKSYHDGAWGSMQYYGALTKLTMHQRTGKTLAMITALPHEPHYRENKNKET